MTDVSVTFEDVIGALKSDPKLPEYLRLPMVVGVLPSLPDQLGPLLNEKVTLKRLMMVQANLFELALRRDFGDDLPARCARAYLETKVEELWDTVLLEGEALDRSEKYDLGAKIGLNLDVEILYYFGALTIADLLRLQPGVLIPCFPSSVPTLKRVDTKTFPLG